MPRKPIIEPCGAAGPSRRSAQGVGGVVVRRGTERAAGWVGVACAALCVLAGCMSTPTTIGGRPTIYKQGPGDPPDTIVEKAGIVAKVSDTAAEPAPQAEPLRPSERRR